MIFIVVFIINKLSNNSDYNIKALAIKDPIPRVNKKSFIFSINNRGTRLFNFFDSEGPKAILYIYLIKMRCLS